LLLDRFWTTLDPKQREQTERDIAQLYSTELPLLGLFFYPAMSAARRTLQGLRLPVTSARLASPQRPGTPMSGGQASPS
jgi:hypothetical protein